MTNTRVRRGLQAAACGFLAVLSGMSATGHTSATPAPEVSISFACRGPSVTLHEPVYIDLTIRNGLSQAVTFDLGSNQEGNFQLLVIEPDGTRIVPPRIKVGGFQRVGTISLAPAGTFQQALLVNQWYQPSGPGSYELQVKIADFALKSESGAFLANQASSALLAVQVAPRNPERLADVCQRLEKSALNAYSFQERGDAALALSYIADDVAVPYLGRVALSSPLLKQTALFGLARIANLEGLQQVVKRLGGDGSQLGSTIRAFQPLVRPGAHVML